MIASVGQASIQAVQEPHKLVVNVLSYSNSKSVTISPRKTQVPKSFVIKFVCFPIQPNPALCAHTFSDIGDVSTQHIPFNYYHNFLCNLIKYVI